MGCANYVVKPALLLCARGDARNQNVRAWGENGSDGARKIGDDWNEHVRFFVNIRNFFLISLFSSSFYCVFNGSELKVKISYTITFAFYYYIYT